MGRRGGYKFTRCVTDPQHFINQYVDYAAERTDAAWDYHEAQAVMLLSLATQGIYWHIPAVPGGLATNLYMLNHGRTSDAKKSTVMNIASEVQRKAMPGVDIPENFTPGALEEILEDRLHLELRCRVEHLQDPGPVRLERILPRAPGPRFPALRGHEP